MRFLVMKSSDELIKSLYYLKQHVLYVASYVHNNKNHRILRNNSLSSLINGVRHNLMILRNQDEISCVDYNLQQRTSILNRFEIQPVRSCEHPKTFVFLKVKAEKTRNLFLFKFKMCLSRRSNASVTPRSALALLSVATMAMLVPESQADAKSCH